MDVYGQSSFILGLQFSIVVPVLGCKDWEQSWSIGFILDFAWVISTCGCGVSGSEWHVSLSALSLLHWWHPCRNQRRTERPIKGVLSSSENKTGFSWVLLIVVLNCTIYYSILVSLKKVSYYRWNNRYDNGFDCYWNGFFAFKSFVNCLKCLECALSKFQLHQLTFRKFISVH